MILDNLNMNSFLKDKSGLALIGVSLAIVIVAILAYGLFYSFKNNNTDKEGSDLMGDNLTDTLDEAKSDIADINEFIK